MMDIIFQCLENSKIFTGCAILFMNIGGKYVSKDLPKSLDVLFENIWLRRLVLFFIVFMTIRDIKKSLLITLIAIILFNHLLNENSPNCILPQKYLDFNKDGKVSDNELERAKNILLEHGFNQL